LPDELTVVVNGPLLTPSGPVSVSVMVAPGVPLPTILACVTPTTGLLGDNDPVKVTVGEAHVNERGEFVNATPFGNFTWIECVTPFFQLDGVVKLKA
jgi:hypothetical protein